MVISVDGIALISSNVYNNHRGNQINHVLKLLRSKDEDLTDTTCT